MCMEFGQVHDPIVWFVRREREREEDFGASGGVRTRCGGIGVLGFECAWEAFMGCIP